MSNTEQTSSIEKSKTSATRTLKPFEEKSKRAQYSEAKKVRDSFESPAIVLAAAQSLSQAGNKDASFVIKKVVSKTGLTAAKARAAITTPLEDNKVKISPEEGLAFLLNQNMTRSQYQAIHDKSKQEGADIWPTYQRIQNTKLECRPDEIQVEDNCALVPLQCILDHTAKRILETPGLKDQMVQTAEQNGGQLSVTMYYKYGFDGSGSHHRSMQPDAEGDLPEIKTLNAT
jgi:hypothetical protein